MSTTNTAKKIALLFLFAPALAALPHSAAAESFVGHVEEFEEGGATNWRIIDELGTEILFLGKPDSFNGMPEKRCIQKALDGKYAVEIVAKMDENGEAVRDATFICHKPGEKAEEPEPAKKADGDAQQNGAMKAQKNATPNTAEENRATVTPDSRKNTQENAAPADAPRKNAADGSAAKNDTPKEKAKPAADKASKACELAEGYHYGTNGIQRDPRLAFVWSKQACAEKCSAEAEFLLGRCYDIGLGTAKDYATAAKYYRTAAKAGSARAMNNLGMMYMKGQGVAKNLKTAEKYFKQASDLGLAMAERNLKNVRAMIAKGK